VCARLTETIQQQLRRAGHRALGVLSRVPQAWESEFRLGRAGRAVATLCAGVAETIQQQLRRAGHHGLRNAMAAALTALATGAVLVLVATGFLGRTAAPPDRVLPIAERGPADQGPRAAPAPRASAPSHDEPRDSPRVETATPVTAAPPTDAQRQPTPATPDSRMASGPVAAVQRPAVAPPAGPTPPVEVVAIRFGVIDRTVPEWTWSWRITIHNPSDTARVNARIEFIEFQGSTRRLVGYEEFCDLRLAVGRLVFIDGIHTLSEADSRRISTMTATVSAATDPANLRTCRPS
jgi:hypothetical protein